MSLQLCSCNFRSCRSCSHAPEGVGGVFEILLRLNRSDPNSLPPLRSLLIHTQKIKRLVVHRWLIVAVYPGIMSVHATRHRSHVLVYLPVPGGDVNAVHTVLLVNEGGYNGDGTAGSLMKLAKLKRFDVPLPFKCLSRCPSMWPWSLKSGGLRATIWGLLVPQLVASVLGSRIQWELVYGHLQYSSRVLVSPSFYNSSDIGLSASRSRFLSVSQLSTISESSV